MDATLLALFGDYAELAFAVIGVCAAVAAMLPAPGEDSGIVYRAVYGLLNFLAVNFGHARNAGNTTTVVDAAALDEWRR